MSNFQEWLFRWCVRSALHAMPYTARLFAVIREEALKLYPEDNAYGVDSYLKEAMGYSDPPPIGRPPKARPANQVALRAMGARMAARSK